MIEENHNIKDPTVELKDFDKGHSKGFKNTKETYECKSIIVGRRRPREEVIDGEIVYPCYVNLSHKNNPHLTTETPFKFLDFKVHKIIIRGLVVNYLIPGNDIVINDLKSITIEQRGPHLFITGVQEPFDPKKYEEKGKW